MSPSVSNVYLKLKKMIIFFNRSMMKLLSNFCIKALLSVGSPQADDKTVCCQMLETQDVLCVIGIVF